MEPPALSILRPVLEGVVGQAQRAWPEEACGVLLGRTSDDGIHVTHYRPSDNISESDRRRRYEINPQLVVSLLLESRESSDRVVGFYHSHPDGTTVPSAYDFETAWPNKVYLIVGVRSLDSELHSQAPASCGERSVGAVEPALERRRVRAWVLRTDEDQWAEHAVGAVGEIRSEPK